MWFYLGVFVIIDLALITLLVVANSRKGLPPAVKQKYLAHWKNIKDMEGRQGVIEADKLLDDLMARRGYKGTLGEKLKKAGPSFTDLNGVWAAHKMRNRLAHELGVKITDNDVKLAMKQFAAAYKDLGLKV